jgi:hypothetical protein
MGTCFGTLFDVALGGIRPDEAGSASGSLSAVQQHAAAIGSAGDDHGVLQDAGSLGAGARDHGQPHRTIARIAHHERRQGRVFRIQPQGALQ